MVWWLGPRSKARRGRSSTECTTLRLVQSGTGSTRQLKNCKSAGTAPRGRSVWHTTALIAPIVGKVTTSGQWVRNCVIPARSTPSTQMSAQLLSRAVASAQLGPAPTVRPRPSRRIAS
eukprot:813813-Rhodomonas_salina.3